LRVAQALSLEVHGDEKISTFLFTAQNRSVFGSEVEARARQHAANGGEDGLENRKGCEEMRRDDDTKQQKQNKGHTL
jgi:hypothetical protein